MGDWAVELTKDLLEKDRSAAEFLSWVEGMVQTLGETPEGTKATRLRCGLAKVLLDEALPLGIFVNYHYAASSNVRIRLVLGNQNFDAVVCDQRLNPPSFSFVEITQAHAGEEEHLRMSYFMEHGHVNMLGDVKKSGTKATGRHVEVAESAVEHSVVLEKQLCLIEEAVQRKIKKEYPVGTALVVVFEDSIAMRDQEDRDALHKRLQPIIPSLNKFAWLAVVGWTKKIYLSREPTLGKGL